LDEGMKKESRIAGAGIEHSTYMMQYY
jgi:hypothetical protein